MKVTEVSSSYLSRVPPVPLQCEIMHTKTKTLIFTVYFWQNNFFLKRKGLDMLFTMVSNTQSSCFNFLSSRTTGVHHYTWLRPVFLKDKKKVNMLQMVCSGKFILENKFLKTTIKLAKHGDIY